jgi:hypothetical protein
MYIYKADTYCDDCGKEICLDLQRKGQAPADPSNEHSYSSDKFPKRCGDDDDHGNSDSPSHCANHGKCLNADKLSDGSKVGKLLGTDLSRVGVAYVVEAIYDSPRVGGGEVARFWAEKFGLHYEQIAGAAKEQWG